MVERRPFMFIKPGSVIIKDALLNRGIDRPGQLVKDQIFGSLFILHAGDTEIADNRFAVIRINQRDILIAAGEDIKPQLERQVFANPGSIAGRVGSDPVNHHHFDNLLVFEQIVNSGQRASLNFALAGVFFFIVDNRFGYTAPERSTAGNHEQQRENK